MLLPIFSLIESFIPGGVDNYIPKIDSEIMGALFMLFEFQVAVLGLMYKINAFNQGSAYIPCNKNSKQNTNPDGNNTDNQT